MKHAYLILAHNEWRLLQNLVTLLDDERNDIFVHIDKKVKNLPQLHSHRSRLMFVSDDMRVDVKWGTSSQVHADFSVLEFAYKNGEYDYFHYLSGVDMPIKSNDYIHHFFEENKGREFVGFAPLSQKKGYERRLRKYYFLCSLSRHHFIYDKVSKFFLLPQDIFGIERNKDIEIQKGEVWVSISKEFAGYALDKKEEIFHMIDHSVCVDELIWQTLIWNSEFKNRIYSLQDEHEGCMREIDWKRGLPYVWGQDKNDYEQLMSSDKLFARKFSSSYPEIIDAIFNIISKQNENRRTL